MDASGIDLQVLSRGLPLESLEPSTAVPLARRENDRLAQIVGRHPDRFSAFAMLPAMDPQSAADELARTVMEHGFKGALIMGRPGGRFTDQSAFTPIWERAQELGAHGPGRRSGSRALERAGDGRAQLAGLPPDPAR